MVEVLLFVNIGLLVVGSVTLTIAVFVLQRARGYIELAEDRLERLREGQERLFSFLREERRLRNNGSAQEEGFAPEAQQFSEERDAKLKIERLEEEIRELHAARADNLLQRSDSHSSENRYKGPAKNVGVLTQKKPAAREFQGNPKIPSTAKHHEPAPTGRAKETQQGAGLAVRHAHPDDDVSLRREQAKQDGSQGGTPVKIFREHYHRYLENYEGYVKLAERLYKMRDDGEVPAGSPAEREWEERLRRLSDGIRRTTARLDILEQYNPELASDERVSHRAEIAQSYSEVEKKLADLGNA